MGLNKKQLGKLESRFNFGFAAGALLFGWMADRGNIRLLYPTVVVLWSLAGFAAGFAESFKVLLACRIALGLFEAGNIPCGVLTVKRLLRPEERTLGNGMFQSGTALGAIIMPQVVLLCLVAVERAEGVGTGWQIPFRVVGATGLLWAAAWLLIVRPDHIRRPPDASHPPGDTYWAIFRNRRFWVCLAVVLSINSAWRSFGYWLPIYLKQEKQYDRVAMAFLSSGFFVAADLGTIAVGAVVLRLHRRGVSLPRARLLCYAGCAGLATLSVVTAFLPKGPSLVVVLLLVGFGALGLFPIYYSLSQEVSARHQGKVTGALSFLNAMYLFVYFDAQGEMIHHLGSFALVLGVTGLFPLVGLVTLAWGWGPRTAEGSGKP